MKLRHRLAAVVLAVLLVAGACFATAYARSNDNDNDKPNSRAAFGLCIPIGAKRYCI